MANGTRFNAVEDIPTDLQFQFLRNGAPHEPFSWDKVEIYPTHDDAVAKTNIIETILSANISSNGGGLGSYTAAAIATAGVYFDRVYVVPIDGYAQWSDPAEAINAFYVRPEDFGGVPSGIPSVCLVSGYLINSKGESIAGATIRIEPGDVRVIGDFTITKEVLQKTTNEVGFWSENLIRSTDSLRIKYKFTISYIKDGVTYSVSFIRIIPDLDTVTLYATLKTEDYK